MTWSVAGEAPSSCRASQTSSSTTPNTIYRCAVHCSRFSEHVRLAIFQLSALRVKICVITDFQVFVKYCSNQLLQDQTLKRLK